VCPDSLCAALPRILEHRVSRRVSRHLNREHVVRPIPRLRIRDVRFLSPRGCLPTRCRRLQRGTTLRRPRRRRRSPGPVHRDEGLRQRRLGPWQDMILLGFSDAITLYTGEAAPMSLMRHSSGWLSSQGWRCAPGLGRSAAPRSGQATALSAAVCSNHFVCVRRRFPVCSSLPLTYLVRRGRGGRAVFRRGVRTYASLRSTVSCFASGGFALQQGDAGGYSQDGPPARVGPRPTRGHGLTIRSAMPTRHAA